MNNRMIEDFSHRYGADVKVLDNVYGYNRTASYVSDRFDASIEIKLSHRAFEHMVEMDRHAEEDYRARKKEERIRARSPAVANAYEQYKMLLALCQ